MGKTRRIVLLILVGLAVGIGPAGRGQPGTGNQEPAPDFNLRKFNLGRVKLSDYRGKVVLVNFWATWCPPCVKEIPDFVALTDDYGEKGLIILGISLDKNPQQVLPGFIRKYKINYPILLDDGRVAGVYGGVTAIPTTFLVDREGNIRQKYVGARTRSVFEADIKKLLE